MEFGIFLNGYIPGPAAHQTELEHVALSREAEYVIFADKHNWKYAWLGEHHSLTEYSHMSAPEVVMGYIAAQTDYIHLSTGINSLSPRKEHPVRYAERAAMLDHFTNNRFEWGTGRGAGSHELASFNIMDKNSTKPEWEEVVREIPRMWEQVDYTFEGETFTVPTPHNVLPKPYGKGHPPIWVACGNPPTFTKAGELGIGAIAFNFEPIFNLRGRIEAYKEGVANCTDPIGQFKNDNMMITNSVICCETREEARSIALRRGRGYLVTMVNLYHDTMPKSQDAITWPSTPLSLRDLAAGDEEALLDGLIEGGYLLCGTPDEVSEQIAAWGDVGMDQLVFGLPIEGMHHDEVLACLELFGDKVIPEFDPDRTHSTDRYRATAKPKYARFNQPLPDDVEWPTVIPESALAQLQTAPEAVWSLVPRDSTATKERLLREAERLFARRGLYQVTVREITEAAEQRNVSALNYHFGSREGLLDAILVRHGDPTDVARGEMLTMVGRDATSRELVAALVVPYAAHLSRPDGRDYLRIIAQLSARFSTWRDAAPGTGPYLREILGILEERPEAVAPAVRRERVVELIMLMTVAMAERARVMESQHRSPELDEPTFVENLTDVLVGVLEAPVRGAVVSP